MSKLTSIGQAAKNALASYLQQAINSPKYNPHPIEGLVVVEPRWPDWKRLKNRTLTIVNAGQRTYGSDSVLGWWHQSELIDPQPPGLPAGTKMWRWTVGWYEQPIQLDLWCWSDEDRDDLVARMDIALHTGPGELSETQPGFFDPVVDYLVLPLAQQDGWLGSVCGAYFSEDGPELIDTAVNAEQSIYRAKWAGTLEMALTVDAIAYPIARNIFKTRMSEQTVPTTGSYDLQITVSGSRPAGFAKNVT